MTESTPPAKKAAPAVQRVAASLTAPAVVEQAPAVDPLTEPAVQEAPTTPRPFDIGDLVEFTDAIKFQFGAQKTYQQGVVLGVVDGDGMWIVATGMQDSMFYDSPRVEFVFEGRETSMRKVEVPGGE